MEGTAGKRHRGEDATTEERKRRATDRISSQLRSSPHRQIDAGSSPMRCAGATVDWLSLPATLTTMVLGNLDLHGQINAADCCQEWRSAMYEATHDGATALNIDTVLPIGVRLRRMARALMLKESWRWHIHGGKEAATFDVPCMGIALHGNGDTLVGAAGTQSRFGHRTGVGIFSLATGGLVCPPCHAENVAEIKCVAIDGDVIASGGAFRDYEDGYIHLWSAASGTLSAVLRNGDARQPITRALALSGGVLVSGDDDAVRLWSITELNVQASWRHPGHKAVTVAICTGADGSTGAISGSITDKSARVWAPNDASAVHVLKHPEWVWTVATEGDVIVTGSHGRIVRLWSLGSGTLIRELNKEPGAGPGLTSDVCLRQGLLVAASADRIVRVWTLDAEHNATGPRKLVGHEGHINGLAISSSGQIVSCGQRSETAPARPRIIVWEPRGCPAL